MKVHKKLRESLINTALVIASIFVSLLLIEAYFAVFNPQLPVQNATRENEFNFFEYDSLLGWKNNPNAEGMFVTPNSTTLVKINSKGLRDKEYDYYKPEGTKRIIVLGDSFAWGYGVEVRERFTEILKDKLPSNYEVINMGVSGYGTDQELLALETEGVKYHPDLVIIMFYYGNDFEDNTHTVRYSYPKPMFVMDSDGNLNLTNIPVPTKEEWLERGKLEEENGANQGVLAKLKNFFREHSQTYQVFSRAVQGSPFLLQLMEKIMPGIEGTIWDQYSLDLTKALLRKIDSVAQNNGAQTLVFIIRDTCISISQNEALDKMAADLSNSGKQNGIMVLDNLPLFRQHISQGEQLTFNEGHWNYAGHKLAAEMIYRKLIEEGKFAN